MNIITQVSRLAGILILTATVIGCGAPPPMPTKVAAPPAPTGTATANFVPAQADVGRGQQVFLDKQCVTCHNSHGEGGIGPKLAQTSLTFDQFLHKVRTAIPPKPAFNETELPTQDAYNIYGWLTNLESSEVVAAAPTPALPSGQILGMKVWTEGQCDSCHGAFAQGSPNGPTLAGVSFPFEMERAKMRQTAATIPEHTPEQMDDSLFQRLYNWLQAGADPEGGC